jgi:hypothetical protein
VSASALAAGPPEDTVAPTISEKNPVPGNTETATTGTGTNGPTEFPYQWKRCNSAGAECVSISGATKSTYMVAKADVGHDLLVVVTATNSNVHWTASSATGNAVAANPGLVAEPTEKAPVKFTATSGEMVFENAGFSYRCVEASKPKVNSSTLTKPGTSRSPSPTAAR